MLSNELSHMVVAWIEAMLLTEISQVVVLCNLVARNRPRFQVVARSDLTMHAS